MPNHASRLLAVLLIAGILVSCSDKKDQTSSGGGTAASTSSSTTSGGGASTLSKVALDAAADFKCSGNWGDRDGVWGLKAYSGNGSCQVSFPGVAGTYRIDVLVQTERDGSSPYRVSINGRTVASGSYPYATGKLRCDCSLDDCPDENVYLGAGAHQLRTGDVIEFWGADDYPCGKDHGSYAKWHRMEFTPN